MKIINLTQHAATVSQQAAGITDLPVEFQAALVAAITFSNDYNKTDLVMAAGVVVELLRDLAGGADISGQRVMIGGMPSFMPVLEVTLRNRGVEVGYAKSERKSADMPQPDGSVRKVTEFVHAGMYWA